MNSPLYQRHQPTRRQTLRRLRRRLILETEAFLNHRLAPHRRRPPADSITPQQVRAARQTPPEPTFLVWVFPCWAAAALVELPGSEPEERAGGCSATEAPANVAAAAPPRALRRDPPANGFAPGMPPEAPFICEPHLLEALGA